MICGHALRRMITSAPDLPMRRDAFLLILIFAGLLGGELHAVVEMLLLPADPDGELPFSHVLGQYLWMGGWFGAAVGLCLTLSRTFWIRMLLCVAVPSALFWLACELAPSSLFGSYARTRFICFRQWDLDSIIRLHEREQRQWLVAATRAVASFVVAHHLVLTWRQKGWPAPLTLGVMLLVGAASGVIFDKTCGMAFQDCVRQDDWSSTILSRNPSGLAQATAHYFGLAAATTLGRWLPASRLLWSPGQSPGSGAWRT